MVNKFLINAIFCFINDVIIIRLEMIIIAIFCVLINNAILLRNSYFIKYKFKLYKRLKQFHKRKNKNEMNIN